MKDSISCKISGSNKTNNKRARKCTLQVTKYMLCNSHHLHTMNLYTIQVALLHRQRSSIVQFSHPSAPILGKKK